MGLFSDIISSVGNGVSDIFGGGGNSDQKKKQQQQQQAPTISAPQNNAPKLNMPAVLQMAKPQIQPIHPVAFGNAPGPLDQPQAPPQAEPAKIGTTSYSAPSTSLFGHLLHGAEDVGKSIAAPAVYLGNTDIVNPAKSLIDQATGNQAASNAQNIKSNEQLGLGASGTNLKGGLEKLAGNSAEALLMGVAPGADSALEGVASKAVPEAAPTLAKALLPKVASNAVLGGAFNDANSVASGQVNPIQLAKSFGTGAAFGGALGGVGDAVPVIRGLGRVSDETAGVTGDKAIVESGTKAAGEPANAPAGDKNAPPEKAPNATETGVKPPAAPAVEPGVPAEPVAPAATPSVGTPSLTQTGDTGQDLQNAAAAVRNTLENPRDFGAGEGVKPNDALGTVIDKLNARPGDQLAKTLGERFGTHLTDTEAGNIEHAIQTGSTKGLSDKESTVVKSLVNDVEKPSDVSRTNLSTDYQSRENHFPQVRAPGSASDVVKTVSKGKVQNLEDVLNTGSRFSENSSMGKFTDEKGNTIVGDADDPKLGLRPDGKGGYTDGKKTYSYSPATSRELRNAGVKLQAPKDALTTYVKDTLAQKDRADAADYLKNNPEKVGLSKVEDRPTGKTTPVAIKGSDGKDDTFYTDKKTAAKVQDALTPPPDKTGLLTKGFNKATSGLVQLTTMNPTVHGKNLAANAFIEAGAKYAKYAADPKLDDNVLYEMRKGGTYTPSFGKNQVGVLSKLTHGASKLNEKALSDLDLRIRYGMFRKFTEDDKLTPEQASQRINKSQGGKSVYGNGNAQFGMFWNYFMRQNANFPRLFTRFAQGDTKPLIRAVVAAGIVYGGDQAQKAVTGNKQAYGSVPGVLSVPNDIIKTADQLKNGQFQQLAVNNPFINHVNPIIPTAAEQILGVDQYGDKFSSSANPGKARLNNALGVTPVTNMFANNGHSVAEKVGNTFGLYEPHVAGDMAVSPTTPGASILNVKGAQNGSSVAFPKDFTGEQEANVANKLGNNYTTKSAAILGTQTQPQQQKYLQATSTLKKYGITDQTDIQNFSKLSAKDQGSYVSAVDTLNKGGTAVSSASVQGQLVKQGDTELAASLNKDIPTSLSQQDKNSLETYSTLGTDGQKSVWLQDNDNAANYYEANINQKQAQGALTTDDTDMSSAWSGAGGTLYVNAAVAQTNKQNNVPQSLVELYKNTTKTEYNDGDISASDSAALAKYAAQLNANGVLDKFGIGDGSSGGSSGSSSTSAAAADRAAGLPYGTISESFVKPTPDTGLKPVNARAFKAPTLLKYTPDTKANPYVRAISVTKGVK